MSKLKKKRLEGSEKKPSETVPENEHKQAVSTGPKEDGNAEVPANAANTKAEQKASQTADTALDRLERKVKGTEPKQEAKQSSKGPKAHKEPEEANEPKEPKDSKEKKGFSLLGWIFGPDDSSDNSSTTQNTTGSQTGTNPNSGNGYPNAVKPAKPIHREPIPFTSRIPKYRPVKHLSLTVILIENTAPMVEYVEQFKQIVKKLSQDPDVMLCIINYGAEVHVRTYGYNQSPDLKKIFFEEDISDKACLYDAIYQMYQEVSKLYRKYQQEKDYDWTVESVKLIGTGTCTENASKTTEENAGYYFQQFISKFDANTKYLSITDASFINAAQIGFRSISSIVKFF